jgi:hypothetical protein
MSMQQWVLAGLLLGPVMLAGCHAGRGKTPSAAMAPALPEVHVDGQCRVRQASGEYTVSDAVCHLAGPKTSQHVEDSHRGDTPVLLVVTVREQEYRLQNTTAGPVAFVVEYSLEKGWTVDPASDPAAAKVEGTTAVFRVAVEPGQTVRLHVGVRHAVPRGEATGVEYGHELLK